MKACHRIFALLSVCCLVIHVALVGAGGHLGSFSEAKAPAEYSQSFNDRAITTSLENTFPQENHLAFSSCRFWTLLSSINSDNKASDDPAGERYLTLLFDDSTQRVLFYSALKRAIP